MGNLPPPLDGRRGVIAKRTKKIMFTPELADVNLILVVRSLERVGDLASNIGEDAVYLQHAKDLRHKSSGDRELPEQG